jgi:hypothetical protein
MASEAVAALTAELQRERQDKRQAVESLIPYLDTVASICMVAKDKIRECDELYRRVAELESRPLYAAG